MSGDVKQSELREAAERLRTINEVEVGCYGESSTPTTQLIHDWKTLANAYLAEHQADDDEPADKEFFVCLWKSEPNRVAPMFETESYRLIWWNHALQVDAGDFTIPLLHNPSRGAARMLHRALGVELREGSDV